jgi:hypothetical protein
VHALAHFDTFIDNALLPGYDSRLVPLHRQVVQALDRTYALTQASALPAPTALSSWQGKIERRRCIRRCRFLSCPAPCRCR